LGATALFLLTVSANALGNEVGDRLTTARNVGNLLEAKQISQLDAMITEARNEKTRTQSGVWRLTVLYVAIANALPDAPPQPGWLEAQSLVENWVVNYPQSPAGPIVYGHLLIGQALGHLGGGQANRVEPGNVEGFLHEIERARIFLETYKATASADPHWYRLMAQVAAYQRWPEAKFSALLSEALEKEPLYYENYFAAVDYYGPEWGGSAEALESFARRAVEQTKSTEGDGMYARIYWYAAQTQYGDSLFRQSDVDWPTMKKSFRDLIAKNPEAWNTNNFARFACLAEDKEMMAELIAKIDDKPLPEVWSGDEYDQCKTWAQKGSSKT
jgi:hypothetical protein